VKCLYCERKTFEKTINEKMIFSDYPNDFVAPLNVINCYKCGEVYTKCKELQKWEKLISDQIVKAQNPTKDMFKFVRKTYGISKKDIASNDIKVLKRFFTMDTLHVFRWLMENRKNIEEQ